MWQFLNKMSVLCDSSWINMSVLCDSSWINVSVLCDSSRINMSVLCDSSWINVSVLCDSSWINMSVFMRQFWPSSASGCQHEQPQWRVACLCHRNAGTVVLLCWHSPAQASAKGIILERVVKSDGTACGVKSLIFVRFGPCWIIYFVTHLLTCFAVVNCSLNATKLTVSVH